VARRRYSRAAKAFASGDVYPIWGTCDGFVWMMQIAAEDTGVLTGGFASENISLPLEFSDAASSSALLAEARSMRAGADGQSIYDALASLPLTLNNHVQGVTPERFAASAPLARAFTVLAENDDLKGARFVSLVEGKGLPFWASQFHPEKNIFEQGVALPSGVAYEAIQHTRQAVAVSQYFANFFVDQCRASRHTYSSAEEAWRDSFYTRTTSTIMNPGFVQVYFEHQHAKERSPQPAVRGQ